MPVYGTAKQVEDPAASHSLVFFSLIIVPRPWLAYLLSRRYFPNPSLVLCDRVKVKKKKPRGGGKTTRVLSHHHTAFYRSHSSRTLYQDSRSSGGMLCDTEIKANKIGKHRRASDATTWPVVALDLSTNQKHDFVEVSGEPWHCIRFVFIPP